MDSILFVDSIFVTTAAATTTIPATTTTTKFRSFVFFCSVVVALAVPDRRGSKMGN